MSRRGPDEWRRAVYKSSKIGDPVRVLLLYLADHMKADRTVSVPRKSIAEALGKSERRVSERVSAAHAAGFLGTVSPGYRGHVPVYQGLFPSVERVTSTSALSGAETRTLSTRERVTPGGPTTTTADLTERGDRRDVGSDEKPPSTAAVRPAVCAAHGLDSCPVDCTHNRAPRRTA